MAKPIKDPLTGAETTGHVWDDTLQEFNNPLPRWWLWTFYATMLFALAYFLIYPSWPIGSTYTKGFSSVTYTGKGGKEMTTHWNTRALLAYDMQTGEQSLKQKEYLSKLAATPYDQISQDPDMGAFVRSYGNGIFGDYCAACHQAGGQGVVGLFPNLVDDAWLWGGSVEQIHQTVVNGRNGYMPPFRETFNDTQLNQVANYVLSLSDQPLDAEAAKQGELIFNGQAGGCYYCHTKEGTGLASQGAANLTDKIWTVANVAGQQTPEAKLAAIKAVISNGISRQMPSFAQRLDKTEIKVLVAYLKQMSSGN
ncbi:MAG: cytochrome-c oxidase, cbb3-type subunit III [Proteobacteria bacterium]|nr:MAG: cytochrome-c oxidase, cbb3-type subunit III [Pseudomonadota bacterium]